jgi:hypothetical protein
MVLRAHAAGAAGALFALTACTGSASLPEESPAKVVQAILDARTAGHCVDYEHYFVNDPLPRCGDPIPVVGSGPRLRTTSVEGHSAEVEVVDHYDCSAWDEDPVQYLERYSLILSSGTWKVEHVDLSETTSDDCFT